ncbi:MAG: hypothetical protein KGS60_10620 [Verrucomicrobia bacterium]|nr:hypothetical protein [Verrucomicrobiota bacterium]
MARSYSLRPPVSLHRLAEAVDSLRLRITFSTRLVLRNTWFSSLETPSR